MGHGPVSHRSAALVALSLHRDEAPVAHSGDVLDRTPSAAFIPISPTSPNPYYDSFELLPK